MNIGGFEILNTLGSGGSGIVYRARHATLGRVVALKQLNRQVREGDKVFERFKREAQMMASIRSDHVVTLYSYQVIDGRPLLEMECLDHASLEDIMMDGPIGSGFVLQVMADVLTGLKALHGAGIVHRDIKPANVLQDEAGRFKLTDFGLSVAETEIKTTFEAATIRYLAPECTSHPPQFDFRSDLYSAGMVAYEAVLGAEGFQGAFPDITPVAAFGDKWLGWLKDANKEATPLHVLRPAISAPISMFVARLMAKDPARRFASADAALEALGPLMIETPPPPRAVHEKAQVVASVPAHAPMPPPSPPRPAAAAAAAVPIAVAVPKKGGKFGKVAMGAGAVVAAIAAVALGAAVRKPKPAPPAPAPIVEKVIAGSLATYVVDEQGTPLSGVDVKILPGNVRQQSKGEAPVQFAQLKAGQYEVTASLDGYAPAVQQVVVSEEGTATARLTLKSASPIPDPAPLSLQSPGGQIVIRNDPGAPGGLGGVVTKLPPNSGGGPKQSPTPAPGPPPTPGPQQQAPPAPPRPAPGPQPGPTRVEAATSTDVSRLLTARVTTVLRDRGIRVPGTVRVSLEMALREAPFQGTGAKTADWVATVRTSNATRTFEGHVLGFADLTLRNDVVEKAAAEIAAHLAQGATR